MAELARTGREWLRWWGLGESPGRRRSAASLIARSSGVAFCSTLVGERVILFRSRDYQLERRRHSRLRKAGSIRPERRKCHG